MKRIHWSGIIVMGIAGMTALLGCQQRPAVPTVALAPTEPVVVIVVTATSLPTLAPTKTVAPTITPIPTLTPVVTQTVTATIRATTAAQATRPPATTTSAEPTQAATTESASPTVVPPSSFPAPLVFAPEEKSFRDGDTVNFEFGSVGPLATDQCYRFEMTLGNPSGPGGVGDYWVGLCGDQSSAGDRLKFTLKPGRFRDEPNYGTLLVSADAVIPPTPEYVMNWNVSVVKMVDANDPIHPNVQALSPASASLQNSFFR